MAKALTISPARLTAARFGPISLVAVWEAPCSHPLSLSTSLCELDAAVVAYQE